MTKFLENIAREILSLKLPNERNNISFQNINEIKTSSSDFYKNFFNEKQNKKIDYYDTKIKYEPSYKLKDFNGRALVGTDDALIKTPVKNDIRLAVIQTHEKTHVYQKFNNKDYNEYVPSFFEILHATYLNKENDGILIQNLSYKIKNAKSAADKYILLKNIYPDDTLEQYIKYMLDFYRTFNLLLMYLDYKTKDLVTDVLERNLFGDISNDDLKKALYLDDELNNINNKINSLNLS